MITITGASGKTGSHLANVLLEKKVAIRCVGRDEVHLSHFKNKGAELFIGDQGNVDFLTKAFTGADVAYLLIPPNMQTSDFRAFYNEMGKVALEAINRSGVKKVVFLSSIGAEIDHDNGPVKGLYDVENMLRTLSTVDIAFLRPAYFMENTLGNIPLIKSQKINGGPSKGDVPFCLIATKDIAEKAAELILENKFTGHKIYDLFGDYLSYKKITSIIGENIGIPALQYIEFTPEDSIFALVQMGLSRNLAESFVELSSGLSKKMLNPTTIGTDTPNTPTRYSEFVRDIFVPMYNGTGFQH
jgi:uncharacterized protein YbjT (DUF2867 family)